MKRICYISRSFSTITNYSLTSASYPFSVWMAAICVTDRFLDIKFSCREQMHQKLIDYDPANVAERAYRKAVDKLAGHLVDSGVLGVVELKLIEKNKKFAAAYEYKVVHRYANDDEWVKSV